MRASRTTAGVLSFSTGMLRMVARVVTPLRRAPVSSWKLGKELLAQPRLCAMARLAAPRRKEVVMKASFQDVSHTPSVAAIGRPYWSQRQACPRLCGVGVVFAALAAVLPSF